jgi:hypothetical protein
VAQRPDRAHAGAEALRRLRSVDYELRLLDETAVPDDLAPGLHRTRLENRSLYDLLRRSTACASYARSAGSMRYCPMPKRGSCLASGSSVWRRMALGNPWQRLVADA